MADETAGSQQMIEDGGDGVAFVCQTCLRAFTTRIGLGVHVRSQHVEVANRAIQTERVKPRWTPEELKRLAEREAAAFGVPNINLHLVEVFGGDRTLEAIKGVRRRGDYKEMIRAARERRSDQRATRGVDLRADFNGVPDLERVPSGVTEQASGSAAGSWETRGVGYQSGALVGVALEAAMRDTPSTVPGLTLLEGAVEAAVRGSPPDGLIMAWLRELFGPLEGRPRGRATGCFESQVISDQGGNNEGTITGEFSGYGRRTLARLPGWCWMAMETGGGSPRCRIRSGTGVLSLRAVRPVVEWLTGIIAGWR